MIDSIKEKRATLELTQAELARVMGVSSQTISFWETKARNMSETSKRLLQAYVDGYRPADWVREQDRRREYLSAQE